jgi:hypothetical protein
MSFQSTGVEDSLQEVTTDERWQLVLRITSSQQFAKAAQLREILLYITRRFLLDETVSIGEHEIACCVLRRRGDFNPTSDNIVRVQISHLRKKLERYFETEGKDETLDLQIPKGSYVPRFDARPESSQLVPDTIPIVSELTPSVSILQISPLISEETIRNPLEKSWKKSYWAMGLGIAILLALCFSLGRLTQPPASAKAAVRKTGENPLLDRIFISDLPISVVVADTNLVILQNVLHTDIAINDYISKDYPTNILSRASTPGEGALLKHLAGWQFTSLADINIAMRCAELSWEFGTKSTIRYARNMNARDFERGNFILIGSRTADPWVTLFESKLNFAFEKDPLTQNFHFRNKHPQPSEQDVYVPTIARNGSSTSYVDIAVVPNLSNTGYVLLLNAATMEANEAAIKLIFRDKLSPTLSKLIASAADDGTGIKSFEIFLRDHAIDRVVSDFDVVAVRRFS